MNTASYRLKEVRIVGGFLDGINYRFSDKLNCIIGARGTGKTTFLEFIRYALNAMPKDPAAQKRIKSIVENNLDGGRIDVLIETREGVSYTISKASGEQPKVIKADGSPSGLNFTPSLFRLDVFSQNEVENIAGQSMSQLALIETFNQEVFTALNDKISELRSALVANSETMANQSKKICELSDRISRLPGLTAQLKELSAETTEISADVNRALDQKAIRDRENIYVEDLQKLYSETAGKLKSLKDYIESALCWKSQAGLEDGDNFEMIQKLRNELVLSNDTINSGLEAIIEELRRSNRRFNEIKAALRLKHDEADIICSKLLEKNKAEQAKSAERRKLDKERNTLLIMQNELGETQRQQERVRTERAQMLSELSEALDLRFAHRKQIVDRINSELMPTIRVSIQQFGNHDKYQEFLASALSSCGIYHNQVARRLSDLIAPPQLAELVRNQDEKTLYEKTQLNSNQTKAVISRLNDERLLADMEVVDLPDLPKIELNDHDTYKTTNTLSTGQKCNTILPILLLDSERPLLVDQPEDNLDNGFVRKTIVDSILRVKQHRQLAFVTHNPNIPVLGDAEHILVLDSDGTHGVMRNCGTVDECKADIVDLLEGGAEAFIQRKNRYSY